MVNQTFFGRLKLAWRIIAEPERGMAAARVIYAGHDDIVKALDEYAKVYPERYVKLEITDDDCSEIVNKEWNDYR